ncbi:WAP-type (Whey Acidic protein) with four-disulfide core [Tenacibaculum sp. 190524A02b]
MKKSILNLGKALNKADQKNVNGGMGKYCESHSDCRWPMGCCMGLCMTPDRYDQICGL